MRVKGLRVKGLRVKTKGVEGKGVEGTLCWMSVVSSHHNTGFAKDGNVDHIGCNVVDPSQLSIHLL